MDFSLKNNTKVWPYASVSSCKYLQINSYTQMHIKAQTHTHREKDIQTHTHMHT